MHRSENSEILIEHLSQFEKFLLTEGNVPKAKDDYVSKIKSAANRLNFPIGPANLASDLDVQKLVRSLEHKGFFADRANPGKAKNNQISYFKKYVEFVKHFDLTGSEAKNVQNNADGKSSTDKPRFHSNRTQERAKWWIYKCNNKFEGDWAYFLKNKRQEWGNVEDRPELCKLRPGHGIIAYQTDRKELVGTCHVSRISGKKKHIYLTWHETIEQKIPPLKKNDPQGVGKISALKQGPVRTLYEISESEVKLLLVAAGATMWSLDGNNSSNALQIEKARDEGEQRTVKSTVRNPQLRADAKQKYGLKCYCCNFDFGAFFGDVAKNIAIVHHLKQFQGKNRKATVKDVRIVCANCHQVIHAHKTPIPVDDLKKQISERWTRWASDGIRAKA